MRECDQCGATVTERYWRVFAIDGRLHGCPDCEAKTSDHLPEGARSRAQAAEG